MNLLAELNMGHIFFLSAALMGAMLVEVGYTLFAPNSDARKRINRRMASSDKNKVSQKDILVQLRKERGMDEEGNMVLPIHWLNRQIVQAGFTTGLGKASAYYGIYVLFVSISILFFTRSLEITLGLLPIVAIMLPYLWLRRRRAKKMNKFAAQLPEAIDLITRGLKAGHPVSVAISMVAREMPDPIGSEFGMLADEITYGSDLVTALITLYERVGHSDLPLLVSSVSIQSTTGGNLREILEGLAAVIRDRQKMKRKVKAISSEGRMSALFLSAMPVMLFGVLLVLIPDYYSGIWHLPQTWKAFAGLLFWLVTGNLIIMKMVSFKV